MDGGQRERFERRLQQERERASRALRQVRVEEEVPQRESAGELVHLPSDFADRASDTEEEEKDFLVASRQSELVAEIDAALLLLHSDPGRYERCANCGKRIETERLDIVPWTRLCARCARGAEA